MTDKQLSDECYRWWINNSPMMDKQLPDDGLQLPNDKQLPDDG